MPNDFKPKKPNKTDQRFSALVFEIENLKRTVNAMDNMIFALIKCCDPDKVLQIYHDLPQMEEIKKQVAETESRITSKAELNIPK